MKLLLITLALLFVFTSAIRIKQDDTWWGNERQYRGGTCTRKYEYCRYRDTWSDECPGKRI